MSVSVSVSVSMSVSVSVSSFVNFLGYRCRCGVGIGVDVGVGVGIGVGVGVGVVIIQEEDINNLYLPFEMRPGTDLTSKLIPNNKTVINIIVHHLLGINIPNNAYLSGSTEWADGKRSDALYIPRNGVTHDLPPILIEVQNCIDQLFMIRLINYCAHVYERYEVLPVVLVFVVKKFSNTTFEEKFVKKANAPYILETQCEFWAKSTNFVSAKSIENFTQDSMDPFVALAYFTVSQAQDLKSLTFAADMTIRFLIKLQTKCKK
ncbi:uncharacterized protein RHIMIDRAFT_290877 [Rhizopus microsporus ATCC 52813]|uniref:Uncharacterized protein n=1 Tax=Rhizopus microsporus ATCC 52813 TaxID=1340429 RepID=A0A2G4T0E6_RHIZD|nr:uncharacterized protein RHIMIDRAFT_290877 [Rhizopus microsporus ATCC 52813]PHZ14146.1 hypothetical protein RHIMIDRAFT_290877 [Rhizopus microsporus ATCC 52813]